MFALQTLVNGARDFGEPGIFVRLEENSKEILQNAASFGWELPALIESGQLVIIDAHLSPEMVATGELS